MVCFSNFLEASTTNFTWYILEYCLNYYKKQLQKVVLVKYVMFWNLRSKRLNNTSQENHLGVCDFAKK